MPMLAPRVQRPQHHGRRTSAPWRKMAWLSYIVVGLALTWTYLRFQRAMFGSLEEFQAPRQNAYPLSGNNRSVTDTGISLTDPILYEGVDLGGDSSTATVMGIGTGYPLSVYQRFIGSLRKSGFQGHILLGVLRDVEPEILAYFAHRNVTPKFLDATYCKYWDSLYWYLRIVRKPSRCYKPYHYAIGWSRWGHYRDWLLECKTCTGPVLVADVRDIFFQLDPFGPGSPVVRGMQVFEEAKGTTTSSWIPEKHIMTCKGVEVKDKQLICAGAIAGTREAILRYFYIMEAEMQLWLQNPTCRAFAIHKYDQSIFNWLYYSGQLPFATAFPQRQGGILYTVGTAAKRIRRQQSDLEQEERNNAKHGKDWLGSEHDITDEEGFFTEFDGSRSRVVHQFDRFGPLISDWLREQDLFNDPMPSKR